MEDDLFSVFKSKPSIQAEASTSKRKLEETESSAKKRKLAATAHDESSEDEDGQPGKAPVVLDSFETEAQQQVQASKGLGGGIEAETEGGQISLTHQVRHQVAIPPDYDYIPISGHIAPEKPARTYPFTLDPFQKVSIASIQRNESVLVSAHTSAGKTVVAEYAIAQCLGNKQRVIYTSPIKALSNQKYREMLAEFGDVGLMTGDVTINPTASCLVMTTEILRSMLYRGSEIMREVAWVVFDEIHYMRDKERGVVWEETIILLPPTVRYVFLSATIPNAMEFAEWICKTKDQPVHVVYTDFRPTPLQHYLFPAGGDGIHLVVDERGVFRDDNFQKAMGSLVQGEDPADPKSGRNKKGKTKKGGPGGSKGPSDIYKIIKMIMVKNYSPVIVFAFSKRECESLALQMSKLEFNTDEEKEMVANVFTNAISGLSDDDRTLPQIQHILPLLKRGIGIHHGGLLPILKEVIEILFQEGLIKCLCATETFSIGLNMPAKTVVFANVRKFDGKEFRVLSGGEYIQMSGRAGRRGLDDRGIVVMMVDEKLDPPSAKSMVKGETDRLDSAFHLGYNMILNLMRVEGISPEYMLEHCFFQFQSAASVPQLEQQLKKVEHERAGMTVDQEEVISDYYDLRQQLDIMNKDLRDVTSHPTYALPFLQPGRMVRVSHNKQDWGWGVVVNYQKRMGPKGKPLPQEEAPQNQYIVDVLLYVQQGSSTSTKRGTHIDLGSGIQPCPPGEKGEFAVMPVLLATIDGISHVRIYLDKDLKPAPSREKAYKHVGEVKKRFPDSIPLLDPIKNMGIKDDEFHKLVKKIEVLENRLAQNALVNSPDLPALYEKYSLKMEKTAKVKEIKKQISAAHSVMHLEELKHRKRALRRLGFCTSEDVVEMKGRVACEISTGDELLLTELVFNGVFNDLSPEQCAALLSCFVFEEKSEQVTRTKKELEVPLRTMQEAARRIAKICQESKLQIDEQEYVSSFKTELMDAVLAWCKGAKFSEICKMTDVFEGSLIRTFRRLQELIRQMAMAAKAIGNEELEEKFTQSLACLERPSSVVFNPSLYL